MEELNYPILVRQPEEDGSVWIEFDVGDSMFVINEYNDRVHLVIIDIPKSRQGEGMGSTMMSQYLNYCKCVGKLPTLNPKASKTHSVEELQEFYSKFGFTQSNTSEYDMCIPEYISK